MTDIEGKAVALLNDVRAEMRRHTSGIDRDYPSHEALCRVLEQHEAFKQEVGFALSNEWHNLHDGAKRNLDRFRIPLPKPDPLVEIMDVLNGEWTPDEYAKAIRAALGERGWEIREKGQ